MAHPQEKHTQYMAKLFTAATDCEVSPIWGSHLTTNSSPLLFIKTGIFISICENFNLLVPNLSIQSILFYL